MSEKDQIQDGIKGYVEQIQLKLLLDSIERSSELTQLLRVLITHRNAAIENKQKIKVTIVFNEYKIAYQSDKKRARLNELGCFVLPMWLLRVWNSKKALTKTKQKIENEIVSVERDSPFKDTYEIIEHLKKLLPSKQLLAHLEKVCLSCIKKPRQSNSLYCSTRCGDNLSKFVNDLAPQSFDIILEKLIKRLVKAGLSYKIQTQPSHSPQTVPRI